MTKKKHPNIQRMPLTLFILTLAAFAPRIVFGKPEKRKRD